MPEYRFRKDLGCTAINAAQRRAEMARIVKAAHTASSAQMVPSALARILFTAPTYAIGSATLSSSVNTLRSLRALNMFFRQSTAS